MKLSGAAKLYSSDQIDLIGTDVYDLPNVAVLADAHFLPFKDGSFDGVWIQAVLEHVLDPWMTVRESRRVLKPSGLVYADTAFMQQVHEGAYDFTRFTVSGHRWLFKNFELIDAGRSGGPGDALRWSIRYCARGLFRSDRPAVQQQQSSDSLDKNSMYKNNNHPSRALASVVMAMPAATTPAPTQTMGG